MGSFSWLRANVDTEKANIAEGDRFACLIPKEFGGGYIEDTYQDYGNLGTKENGRPKYDLYELLAFWNNDRPYFHGAGETVKDNLHYNGDFPNLKEIDEFTDANIPGLSKFYDSDYKMSLINEAKDLCIKTGLNFKRFLEGSYVHDDNISQNKEDVELD
jgi:hypothetical protein